MLTAGYTTTDAHDQGADRHWVCPQCAEDFAEELRLRVEGGPAAHG